MLGVMMSSVKARADFARTVARAGLKRKDLADEAGVSVRTIDALANPGAAGRGGRAREITAWKIAAAFGKKTGRTDEAAFAWLFEDETPSA
jgi:DNA-binding XRE family transcriptional regulator